MSTQYTSGYRLSKYRASRGLSQQKLADNLGVSRSYIGDIEAGRSEPSREFINTMLTKTDVSSDWLLTGEGSMVRQIAVGDTWRNSPKPGDVYKKNIGLPRAQESTAVPESRPYDPALDDAEHVMVPKLSVQLAAGHGAAAPEVETATGFLAFRREWMQCYGLQPGQVSAVDVTGDSMEPMLSDGDTVLVDHRRNEAKQGKVFAVRVEDDLLVKRLQRQPDGGWLLTSDNESYEPVSMVHHAALIGEVVWRGTWLGAPMASKKQVAHILRLFEIMARRRVETGEAESFDQAIADIEEEMRQDGVSNEDVD